MARLNRQEVLTPHFLQQSWLPFRFGQPALSLSLTCAHTILALVVRSLIGANHLTPGSILPFMWRPMAHTWRKLALRRKFDKTPAGLSNKHVTVIAWVGSLLTLFTKPSSIVYTFPSIFIKQPANPLIPKGIQGYDQYMYRGDS